MASRLQLQTLLENLLPAYKEDEDTHVYFQPPASVNMLYPAIRYSLKDIANEHADDIAYIQSRCYDVMVIDEDPDSSIVTSVAAIPMCSFDRHYTADNLNHWTFILYF
jgi:hypothetical protein